jgi:deoxyhypusine synthase
VPIFCPPSRTRRSVWVLSQARHRDQTAGHIDVIGDIIESANVVIRRPSTATIVLGGGTPKNFINQASVQAEFYDDRVGGHKFAIQIVTDAPYYGGASGSSLEEAQSWGKLSIESEKVTVHCDVTLALPLLVTALETTSRDASHKRKRPEFDPSGALLVVNGQPLADNRYQES